MRVWKNERGLTLTELMAAVVILGIVAVPVTSIGTTFLQWYQEDQQLNEVVLLASRVMVIAKAEVERTGTRELAGEKGSGRDGNMKWSVITSDYKLNDELVEGLIQLDVVVKYPDVQDPAQTHEYLLTAVARPRVQP